VNGTFTASEFIRYAAVGASGVVVDLSVLALLHEGVGLPLLLANAVSFSVACSSNFLLNRYWTFRERYHRHVALGGGLFFIGALIGLGINEAGLWALNSAGLYWVIAKLAMTLVVLVWNYTFNASVTFRRRAHPAQPALDPMHAEERPAG
jgi:putative flippase GtrA